MKIKNIILIMSFIALLNTSGWSAELTKGQGVEDEKEGSRSVLTKEMFDTHLDEGNYGIAWRMGDADELGDLWRRRAVARAKTDIKKFIEQGVFHNKPLLIERSRNIIRGFYDGNPRAAITAVYQELQVLHQTTYEAFDLDYKAIGYTTPGTINAYTAEIAPDGWLVCDGQRVNAAMYADLYRVIGRRFTPPVLNPPREDGEFCLPDLRGRVIVCMDGAAGRVTSDNTLGASGGEEKHQLTIEELASHHHTYTLMHTGTFNLSGGGGPFMMGRDNADESTQSVGGDQPHNIMQPYLILNYIIKY